MVAADAALEGAERDRMVRQLGLRLMVDERAAPFQAAVETMAAQLPAISLADLLGFSDTLNACPRKTLGWRTPAEALDEYLSQINKHFVTMTG